MDRAAKWFAWMLIALALAAVAVSQDVDDDMDDDDIGMGTIAARNCGRTHPRVGLLAKMFDGSPSRNVS